ncbi:MAG: hypothetical protein HQ519_01925 [Planctomycetes bacterium]|nr:hypothetical protein [Planctomycetota bacterium]
MGMRPEWRFPSNEKRWGLPDGYKETTPTTTIKIYGHDGLVSQPGRGFALDAHLPIGGNDFFVRDCAGVADAVALDEDDPDRLEVAVVYPHFVGRIENPVNPLQPQRHFDLRIVTCTFNVLTKERTKESGFTPLWSNLHFDGEPAPTNVTSPGLILPDLAPSSEERAFWLVHERQKLKSQGTNLPLVPDGRIKLEYYKLEDQVIDPPGNWVQKAAKTFQGSSQNWSWKRRPMVSTYVADTDEHVVSIAFSTVDSMDNPADSSSNVVYEHWEYEGGSLISPPTYPGVAMPIWDPVPVDSGTWLDRPIPLHARTISKKIRRCYLTGNPHPGTSPTQLVDWNPFTTPGTKTVADSDANSGFTGIRRTAVVYKYDSNAINPDYFAVTWEKLDNNSLKRVYIMME